MAYFALLGALEAGLVRTMKDAMTYLCDTASATSLPGGGSAIGVATVPSPVEPWVDSGAPANTPGPSAAANRQVYTRRPAQPVARSVQAGAPRQNIHCHSLVLDV